MESEILKSGQFTKDGKKYMNGNCLIDTEMEIQPHGVCIGNRGMLIVPLQPGINSREVGFKCTTCSAVVYANVRGVCL